MPDCCGHARAFGSGETIEAALEDFQEGMRKEGEPRFWNLEKR